MRKNIGLDKVKIARVSTVVFFIEAHLSSQISALVQSGAKVTLIASEKKMSREIEGADYVSLNIPRKISLLNDVLALMKLFLLFFLSKFTIVHSTTPKAGLLCALGAKLSGVPVRLHTFTGQPWVEMRGIKRVILKSCDRVIAMLNTHCYADSFSQRDFLVKSGICSYEKISVLGKGSVSGIDLKRFNPARFSDDDNRELRERLGINPGTRVLLFVGRLTRDKGIVELLLAYEKVLTGGLDVSLVILGPPEPDAFQLLATLPKIVEERLVMPGFSNEPERFMAIADMLVLPSYREGFGTVVIEAAAMGIPAIGSDIYGLSDAIVDGITGLLVPVKDADSLNAALEKLLRDDELRKVLGENARLRVERDFSDTHMNELLKEEYSRLLMEQKIL